MNLIILLVIILVLPSGAYPQGFSPSRDASSACRTVQPAGAWRDCVERYDKKVQSLKEDPAYQEDLRLKKQQVEMDGQRIELEKQRIDSLRSLPGLSLSKTWQAIDSQKKTSAQFSAGHTKL